MIRLADMSDNGHEILHFTQITDPGRRLPPTQPILGAGTKGCLARLRHKIFMSLNWFINFKASILKKINLFKWL
jgi:hypothetical protein